MKLNQMQNLRHKNKHHSAEAKSKISESQIRRHQRLREKEKILDSLLKDETMDSVATELQLQLQRHKHHLMENYDKLQDDFVTVAKLKDILCKLQCDEDDITDAATRRVVQNIIEKLKREKENGGSSK